MIDVISSFTALVGVLLGGGGVLFWKQDKRAKVLENEAKQSDEWRKLYERSDQDSRDKDAKIDAMYAEKKELRQELDRKSEEITELKLKNKELEYQKCQKFECTRRLPPRFFVCVNKSENNENQADKNS